jgi:hypothetical protein
MGRMTISDLSANIISDCSGQPVPYENEDQHNRINPNPAPYEEGSQIPDNERDLDIFHRMIRRPEAVPESQDNDNDGDADNEASDAESEEEQEQVQVARRLPIVVQHPFITRESVLYYSLQLINFVWAFLSTTAKYTKKVSTSVYSGLQEQTYYFFNNSPVPWDARRVNLNAAGSPHVDWYYNADTKMFSREENDGHYHHFPYLTAEIYHGDLSLYDITSFTESLKWSGGEVPPSANHVLAAWFIETGVLLDPSLPLVLRVCNQEGEMNSIQLHQQTPPAAAST